MCALKVAIEHEFINFSVNNYSELFQGKTMTPLLHTQIVTVILQDVGMGVICSICYFTHPLQVGVRSIALGMYVSLSVPIS